MLSLHSPKGKLQNDEHLMGTTGVLSPSQLGLRPATPAYDRIPMLELGRMCV